MKKNLGLFFVGLFVTALGVGCLNASFNRKGSNEVKADEEYITFENGVATLGRYPQTLSEVSTTSIKNYGSYNTGTEIYTYDNKEYAIRTVEADSQFIETEKFNNGNLVKDSNHIEKAFLVEDLKWEILSTGDGYADLITTRVIDRRTFDNNSKKNYLETSLYNFNNTTFLLRTFDDKELKFLKNFSTENVYFVNLPEEAELKDYEDRYLKYPSDYAIASTLSGNYLSGGKTYENAPYWTKTIADSRIKAFWSKQGTTNCLVSDPKIGVRPVIRVAYNKRGGGGGTAPNVTPSVGGGNVILILGIIFIVLGGGGLITLFIYWAKKHPSGKPPIWLLASIGGTLLVSMAGLGCLAGGMTGGGVSACFKYGYYVQVGQYSGNNIVQVGYTAWLVKSDGTVFYCSSLKDADNASDFSPDNYMTGVYKIEGSKLIIDIPERYIQNFGTIGGTIKYTITDCEHFKDMADTYRWVRGE